MPHIFTPWEQFACRLRRKGKLNICLVTNRVIRAKEDNFEQLNGGTEFLDRNNGETRVTLCLTLVSQ